MKVERIVDSLIHAFDTDIMGEATWLDDYSRKAARRKVAAVIRQVGYPDFILNDTTLNKLYENVCSYEHLNRTNCTKPHELNYVHCFYVFWYWWCDK
jgi:predicted metalloendopeptidase